MSKKRFCWFDFKKNKLLLDINWAEYYELWCSNLTVTLIRLETDYSYFQIVKTVYLLWLTPTNETILFCCHGIFPMKSQWRTTITWKGELNFFTIGLFFKWSYHHGCICSWNSVYFLKHTAPVIVYDFETSEANKIFFEIAIQSYDYLLVSIIFLRDLSYGAKKSNKTLDWFFSFFSVSLMLMKIGKKSTKFER